MSEKKVKLGNLTLGGEKIYIQSMLNVPASDISGSVEQAKRLEQAGCEIIRAAVPTPADAQLIYALKNNVSIPVVADIHFDYKAAIEAANAGADKIRINPGNIGGEENVKAVADICNQKGIPIRIGVNSGSVEKELLAKYGMTPQALCESISRHIELLNRFDFDDIVLSVKSSDVRLTIASYRYIHERFPYPLHLGVTEAGTTRMGIIKSSAGIGSLLCDGIGDTIRVSLTADPVEEIYAAKDILRAVGLGEGIEIISCPTCGRTQIDLISLANEVEQRTRDIKKNLKVAVMGCAVNGPGEARHADVGIAGGKGEGILFAKGEIIRKLPENELVNALMEEIEKLM
ncbi:MAG: flavodoxin-dependent (E)-4-hydroxy-3-methylbut-2-enyl-diphosphate synthase [Eubacterium sp.]|nr:flavodoxin-dependent (E)-4-hydroxy-3-methylbut-2-enyl-diphosphate synthase [Eubacterium sp.]